MAKIHLNGMEFYSNHGHYKEEQQIGTNFRVDLTISYDSSKAESSDNLEDTINYLELYKTISEEMDIPSHILEHLARRILNRLLDDFPEITDTNIKITKLSPPLGGCVKEVTVELGCK